jgi:lipid II:glycine glycyltransferase (peptidoglycan interpeptide bridge formation enzyme)
MNLLLKLYKNKKLWNDFVQSSPQGNIFCTTPFLDSLKYSYQLFWVKHNNQPQLGVVIINGNNKPFMYQGILFSPESQSIKKNLKLVEFLFNEFKKKHSQISLSLHHSIKDIRGFQWFHYHQPKLGHFAINLRYTGLINLKKYSSFNKYLIDIRKVRRYEYHQAKKNKLKTVSSPDIDQLDNLHKLTFQRQGIKRSPETARNLKNISQSALDKGFGELLFCQNSHGKIISGTLFLHDHHSGYYLFGATDPKYRSVYSNTFLILENIKHCFKQKLKWVDVCGINSPNRGDFKTSFNAIPTPYFEVNWKKPK